MTWPVATLPSCAWPCTVSPTWAAVRWARPLPLTFLESWWLGEALGTTAKGQKQEMRASFVYGTWLGSTTWALDRSVSVSLTSQGCLEGVRTHPYLVVVCQRHSVSIFCGYDGSFPHLIHSRDSIGPVPAALMADTGATNRGGQSQCCSQERYPMAAG